MVLVVAPATASPLTGPAPPPVAPAGNSGPPAPVPPLLGVPVGARPVASATASMVPVCDTTPKLKALMAASPNAGADKLKAWCIQYGKPLPASAFTAEARFRHRHHARPSTLFHTDSPSTCGDFGCIYIWLYNQGGGWGYVEYQADPCCSVLKSGTAYFGRYTKSNGSVANWSDNVEHNCGPQSWCGYRYIYPISGTSNSWVEATWAGGFWVVGTGQAGYFSTVITWNYITH